MQGFLYLVHTLGSTAQVGMIKIQTNNLISKLKNLAFFSGHERTIRAKKNIFASFIIKGISITIGLALVPLIINYLDPTKYGIWITLSSIAGWFGFFDIGLGNGLRNRFAEALALGKYELAKTYISTTYAILSLIIGSVLSFFYLINPFLNWNKILNAGEDLVSKSELSILALIVFTFFCLNFIFKLIVNILSADQRVAKADLIDLIGKAVSFFLILILTKITQGSLIYLGIALSSLPTVVLLLSSIWFFNGKYKAFKPSFKTIDFRKIKDLLNLGIRFFIIQLSVILLYQTNNIIISHLFGPEQVTSYNVAFKYFSVLMIGFAIIRAPFWSAFTEAWAKKEIDWIKNIMRKLISLWSISFIIGLVMIVASKWVYILWVGDQIFISYTMSGLIAIWVLLITWTGIFTQFLNGVGVVRLQMYIGISAAFINVPFAIFLGKIIGIEGVLISNIIVLSVGVILYPIQYNKLIKNKAKNIFST